MNYKCLEFLTMNMIDRIKQKMADRGLEQKDLVLRLGVSKGTISNWLNEKNKGISEESLERLSKVLKTTPLYLRYGYDPASSTEESNVAPAYFKEHHKYPVISWVQAGDWGEAVDMFQPGHADQWEASDANVGENAFWLRVVGDSMTAPSGISIPEGHMILVDPTAPADNGSLVIAKLTDSHEVTFKKLVIDAGQKYLKPLNPNYRTIEINGNCRIVGVVKEAKIKL